MKHDQKSFAKMHKIIQQKKQKKDIGIPKKCFLHFQNGVYNRWIVYTIYIFFAFPILTCNNYFMKKIKYIAKSSIFFTLPKQFRLACEVILLTHHTTLTKTCWEQKNGKSFHSFAKSSPGSEWRWFMENETSRSSEVQRTVPMVRPLAALMWSVMVLLREWWWENGLPVQEPLKWLITVRRENNGLWPAALSLVNVCINKRGGSNVLASLLTSCPTRCRNSCYMTTSTDYNFLMVISDNDHSQNFMLTFSRKHIRSVI